MELTLGNLIFKLLSSLGIPAHLKILFLYSLIGLFIFLILFKLLKIWLDYKTGIYALEVKLKIEEERTKQLQTVADKNKV